MVYEKKYQHRPDYLANYDFSDILSGIGYLRFYLSQTKDDSGTNYILIDRTIKTTEIVAGMGAIGYGDPPATVTRDFDTAALTSPRVLEGECYCSLRGANDYVGDADEWYFTVTLYSYDGTTETSIASGTSETSSKRQETVVFNFTVPKTLIKIGERIRAGVAMTGKSLGTGGYHGYVGTCPLSLNSEALGNETVVTDTDSYIDIPFKIFL